MHYVIGDIHCQIKELKLLLNKLKLTDNDKVYFVGDWFDREFCKEDLLETGHWMLENITTDGMFVSAVGNHDLDFFRVAQKQLRSIPSADLDALMRLCFMLGSCDYEKEFRCLQENLLPLIGNFNLFFHFNVNDKDYIVTHNWLEDRNGGNIGSDGFNAGSIDVHESIWNRAYNIWEPEIDCPIIIHGHTPTTNLHDEYTEKYSPLTEIYNTSNRNINVDCGAFRSLLRGGNLAAYCVETGKATYAYDRCDFNRALELVCDDDGYIQKYNISIGSYLTYLIFHNNYHNAFNGSITDIFTCNSDLEYCMKYLEAYDGDDMSYQEKVIELTRSMKRVRRDSYKIAEDFWLSIRNTIISEAQSRIDNS